MTYGWARAELVGALINGSFLVALCVYVALELIARFVRPPVIDGERFGLQFIIVASLGLVVNTLGTVAFWCAGAKAHHSHSHAHGHADSHRSDDVSDHDDHDDRHDHLHNNAHGLARSRPLFDGDKDPLLQLHSLEVGGSAATSGSRPSPQEPTTTKRQWNANRYGIFLHYLGDALSSLVVLIVGIVLKYNPTASWAPYADAGASAAIVVFLLWSTLPLMKRVTVVLMQSVPPGLKMAHLASQLRAATPGIVGLHDLHVWRLDEQRTIGTVHVVLDDAHFRNAAEHVVLRARLARVLHDNGVHAATVQLEPHRHTDSICAMQCVDDCGFREASVEAGTTRTTSSTATTTGSLSSSTTLQPHHQDDHHHHHHSHSHAHSHHAPTVVTSGALTGK
jgi:zinc transporter 1